MKLRQSELEHLLRTIHSSVLHCPQCSERSQLGLGQALDACDIQSLIGPVTAQVQKLKLVKRSMYGRAKLPLLRQRLLNAG